MLSIIRSIVTSTAVNLSFAHEAHYSGAQNEMSYSLEKAFNVFHKLLVRGVRVGSLSVRRPACTLIHATHNTETCQI